MGAVASDEKQRGGESVETQEYVLGTGTTVDMDVDELVLCAALRALNFSHQIISCVKGRAAKRACLLHFDLAAEDIQNAVTTRGGRGFHHLRGRS